MNLSFDEFSKAVEYVFQLKKSVIFHEETNCDDINRTFELAYIGTIMFELSDTNDYTEWRIKIVNDDSFSASCEIIKSNRDFYRAVEIMSGFLKYVKYKNLKGL